MALYIDASALVSLIVVEPYTRWAQALILPAAEERLVSDFAAAEVASALSNRVRMGQTTWDLASDLLLGFDAWSAADAVQVVTTGADVAEAASWCAVSSWGCGRPTPCISRWPLVTMPNS